MTESKEYAQRKVSFHVFSSAVKDKNIWINCCEGVMSAMLNVVSAFGPSQRWIHMFSSVFSAKPFLLFLCSHFLVLFWNEVCLIRSLYFCLYLLRCFPSTITVSVFNYLSSSFLPVHLYFSLRYQPFHVTVFILLMFAWIFLLLFDHEPYLIPCVIILIYINLCLDFGLQFLTAIYFSMLFFFPCTGLLTASITTIKAFSTKLCSTIVSTCSRLIHDRRKSPNRSKWVLSAYIVLCACW